MCKPTAATRPSCLSGLAFATKNGLSQATDIVTVEGRETHRRLGKDLNDKQPVIYMRKYCLRQFTIGEKFSRSSEC